MKMAHFFLLKRKINALDISLAFTKMKKEMLFVSALMWKNLSSTMDGISKFCPKIVKYFFMHNCPRYDSIPMLVYRTGAIITVYIIQFVA